MAEYYNIGAKEQTTFRIDKNLYNDLSNYADIKGLNKAEAINEILFKFFKGTTLTNNYLPNKAGLYFKIPLDLDIKKEFIQNKTKLNKEIDNSTIGDNTTFVKIKQIPNNLDVFIDNGIAGSFQANKDGVLHCGIDFVLVFEALKKPTTLLNSQLDINLLDCIYCFYFEVTSDNTTNVYLINPYEAINKLSDVNNRITGDKLIDMVETLEEIQQQTNYNYKIGMENLKATSQYLSSKKQFKLLDDNFMALLVAVAELSNKTVNENIILPKSNENTPTRLLELSTMENTTIN